MLSHIFTNKYLITLVLFLLTYKYFNNLNASLFIAIGSIIILEASYTLCSINPTIENFNLLKTAEDRKNFCDMMNKVRIGCETPNTDELKGLCKKYTNAIGTAKDTMLKILNKV